MSETLATDVVQSALSQWPGESSSLLQILIHIQQKLGHVPEAVRDLLSEKLDVQPTTIDGVVSFYSFLSNKPVGHYDIRFSDNIVDRMLGSRELASRLMSNLGVEAGKHDPAKDVTIDFTSCTGMGDQGPAALVNGMTLTRLTPERIDAIASLVQQGTPVDDWPAGFFEVQENLVAGDILLGDWYHAGAALQAVQSIGRDAILEQLDATEVLTEERAQRGRAGVRRLQEEQADVAAEDGHVAAS